VFVHVYYYLKNIVSIKEDKLCCCKSKSKKHSAAAVAANAVLEPTAALYTRPRIKEAREIEKIRARLL